MTATLDTRGVAHDPGSNWRDRAACLNYEAEWWFALEEETRARAVRICVIECPVRTQCLEYALEKDERHGVWAGYDISEHRIRIRRQRDKARRDAGPPNPRLKLTDALVEQIRALAKQGLAQRTIAQRLDIAQTTVSTALRRDS